MTWFVAVSGGPANREFLVGGRHVSADALQHSLTHVGHLITRIPERRRRPLVMVVPDAALADISAQHMPLRTNTLHIRSQSDFMQDHMPPSARKQLESHLIASSSSHVRGAGTDDEQDDEMVGHKRKKHDAEPVAAASSSKNVMRDVGRERHQKRAAEMHRLAQEEAEKTEAAAAEVAAEVAAEAAIHEAEAQKIRARQQAHLDRVNHAIADLLRCTADINLCAARIQRAATQATITSTLEQVLASLKTNYSRTQQLLLPSPDKNAEVQSMLEHLDAAVTSLVQALDANETYTVQYGSREMREMALLIRQISVASGVAIELAPAKMNTDNDAFLAAQLSREPQQQQQHHGGAGATASSSSSSSASSASAKRETELALAQVDSIVVEVEHQMSGGAALHIVALKKIVKQLTECRSNLDRVRDDVHTSRPAKLAICRALSRCLESTYAKLDQVSGLANENSLTDAISKISDAIESLRLHLRCPDA